MWTCELIDGPLAGGTIRTMDADLEIGIPLPRGRAGSPRLLALYALLEVETRSGVHTYTFTGVRALTRLEQLLWEGGSHL